jgi:hypothetical protein
LYGTTIRDDHWEKMNGTNFVWAPDGMSVQALDRHYQDVVTWFYRQKRVRRRYLQESIRNPGHLVRLARAGLGFGTAKAKSYLSGRRGLLIDRDETHLDVRPEAAVAGAAGSEAVLRDERRRSAATAPPRTVV